MEGIKADRVVFFSLFPATILPPLALRCVPAGIVYANCHAKGPHLQPSSPSLLSPTWFFTAKSHAASVHIQNAWLDQGRILCLCLYNCKDLAMGHGLWDCECRHVAVEKEVWMVDPSN